MLNVTVLIDMMKGKGANCYCISSSGIEQESLPIVSSSVNATRVRHTQM